jgi:hypothetical protein
MQEIHYNRHSIRVKEESWNGKETVYYDSQVVSEKIAWLGTTHLFVQWEDGEKVQYEVETGANPSKLFLRPYVIIRRNGMIIFINK